MIRFIDIDGTVIRTVTDGPPGAPAVLLIHSLAASLELWDPQVEVLARSFRVIRFDLRGHGLSELGPVTIERLAADAVAVLDDLGIESAHVAGLSIGGAIAMAMASKAPARVRSLMLCGTSMTWPTAAMWQERVAQVRASGMEAVVEGTLSRWVSPAYGATAAGRGLRAMLMRTQLEAYASGAGSLAGLDLTAVARQLAMPTTVIVGENDPSAPVASSRAIHEAIAGSELVVISGGYHVPLGEHADAMNAAILGHLARATRGADSTATGTRVRTEVLGADHVARATAAATDLDRDFQALITKTAWAEVWSRPHFDRRTRSIVTIAILAALGRDDELELHVRAIRNTGATHADLTELLLHVAVYAGIPAANAAMKIAKRVVAEMT